MTNARRLSASDRLAAARAVGSVPLDHEHERRRKSGQLDGDHSQEKIIYDSRQADAGQRQQ